MITIDASGYWALADAFVEGRESPNTRSAYARDLRALAEALECTRPEGDLPPGFAVPEDAASRAAAESMSRLPESWWQDWRDSLPGRPASRRRRVAGVRAFCRWWSRMFGLENPVADLAPPATGGQERVSRETVSLTAGAMRKLCEAAARPGPLGARDAALVEVLYGCGLRASELASLDLSGCMLDDATDPHLIVRGKGDKVRPVAVPRQARAALTAYLGAARPELRARDRAPRGAQTRHRDADAVFLNARGRRLTRGSIWRIVSGAARRAGLLDDGGRVFPHALRHSCGTHLIQSGVDIRYVQAHLGHASPTTTEIYTHVSGAHLRDDFDRAHPRSRRAG